MVHTIFSIFLTIVLFSSSLLQAQSDRYTVTRANGQQIGIVTASAKKDGGALVYNVLSDVNFKVLWKQYHRKTTNEVRYQQGTVMDSYSCVYMNNQLEDSAAFLRSGAAYQCFRSPDISFQLDHHVVFSTAKLYFQEPVGVAKVYSERFLEYCQLQDLGNHRYKLLLPNGKSNYYTYSESRLTELLVERTWFDLTISPE